MIFPSGRRERKPDPMKFSKKVVAAMLISVAAFTVTMVVVFLKMGSVPDTLVTAFFAFAGGEAGVLGLIRFGDSKYDNNDPRDDFDGAG